MHIFYFQFPWDDSILEGAMAGKKARIFLLVDLRENFSDLGLGGRKKINKKALKNVNWSFSELFFFISTSNR